jgi:hypothetical protein
LVIYSYDAGILFVINEYKKIDVTFPDQLIFVGKIDAIAQESSGMSYLVEHKTVKTIPEDGSQMGDFQTASYLKAIEHMDIEKPKGILWDYLRSKAPVIPELLQSGKLTEARNKCDTDVATYFAAIKKHNLDPEKYVDMLSYLEKTKVNAFYRRCLLPSPSQSMIDQVWTDFQNTAIHIAAYGEKCRVKNLDNKDCKFCTYQPLCHAEMHGNDIDTIIKSQYKKKEKKE